MNKNLELALQLVGAGIISFILLFFYSDIIMKIMKYGFYLVSIGLVFIGACEFLEYLKTKKNERSN